MNIIMSSFCFLSVQTVNFCGHIARYGQWSLHPLRFASPPLIIRTHLKTQRKPYSTNAAMAPIKEKH